ncbi:MAG: hypothetical protein FGM33_03680 [Candidatus Kapabacteria bacterium]|nr:hypothetical protein [Candidatus Kapabacteria bacterium]
MFDVGGAEFLVIILAILLLFGPKSLPDFARQMGKGLRQFRKAQEDLTQQIRDISADAAVREALDTAPTTVVRPPSGGLPISRTSSEVAPETADATSTEASSSPEAPTPDEGPDASLNPPTTPPEQEQQKS